MAKSENINTALLSMTGFGRGRVKTKRVAVDVEIKSFNHRFLDSAFKLPRVYSHFEHDLRGELSARVQRGRIEVYVARTVGPATLHRVHFDQKLFNTLVGVARTQCRKQGINLQAAEHSSLRASLVLQLMNRSEVLGSPVDGDPGAGEEREILSAFRQALTALLKMKQREGVKLKQELMRRIAVLSKLRSEIDRQVVRTPEVLKDRLLIRIRKLAPEVVVDEARLAQEVAYLADKVDVTEELVRLRSHLDQFERSLTREPSGKRFDFLLQEIAREFNTISSKAQDSKVQSWVVHAKTEIEKLREQVQNIE